MGSFELVITDYNERPCDNKTCPNTANQYRVTVIDNKAIVEKYCWRHKSEMEKKN